MTVGRRWETKRGVWGGREGRQNISAVREETHYFRNEYCRTSTKTISRWFKVSETKQNFTGGYKSEQNLCKVCSQSALSIVLVTNYLTEMDINTIPCPFHKPDLAPSNSGLLPKLKGNLKGCFLKKNEAVIKVLDVFTLENFHGSSMKWLEYFNKSTEGQVNHLEGD